VTTHEKLKKKSAGVVGGPGWWGKYGP